MYRRLFAPLFLTLALLVLPPAGVAQDTDGPSGTISTEASAQTDAAIATRLREILAGLEGYEDITVLVSDGIVTLRGTTPTATEIGELTLLVNRVEGVVALRNEVTETTDLARKLDPAFERFKARLEQLWAFLPIAGIAATAFAAIAFLGSFISSWRQPWDRLAPNAFVADLYRQIVMLAFLTAGLVIALDIMNATALLSTILGAAGIVGLALGFAVRDTVENYIASIMLSIRQPFRPNDTVEINGDQGKVIRLTSRATILLSFDGNHIRIPNATVFKSRIINFTQNSERRFLFSIILDPQSDLFAARALAVETLEGLPFTLKEPQPQAWLEELTPAGVELAVAGWIDQRQTSINLAKGEALRLVKLALESAGVTLADAVQRIKVDQPEPAPGPAPVPETTVVEEVAAVNEEVLEKYIEAERSADENEDLLTRGAAKE